MGTLLPASRRARDQMADSIAALVSEAKRSKYSLIVDVSEHDILKVWDAFSTNIRNQMLQTKGLTISGFGTFTFSQRKVDVGMNKPLVLQRPVLLLSEVLMQTHTLSYPKQHASGHIPVMQVNYSMLSSSTGFERETVENCLRELLRAFERRLNSNMNLHLDFFGVGRFVVKEKKGRMKFFKEFIEAMDTSGKLKSAFRKIGSRPESTGSIISETYDLRPSTTGMLSLPRITEVDEDSNECTGPGDSRPVSKLPPTVTRPETPFHTPRAISALSLIRPIRKTSSSAVAVPSRPSTCSHSAKSPHELCYVCHQRDVNNVAISVEEEKRERERMQEKLIQDYLLQRNMTELARERSKTMKNKKMEQQVAQFNLERGEMKKMKEKDLFSHSKYFYPSYIFQNRSMTPCFTKKQLQYCKQLDEQVKRRRNMLSEMTREEMEQESKQQQLLRKELQAIDQQYSKAAAEKKQDYLRALDDQISTKSKLSPPSPPCQPVFEIQKDYSQIKFITDRQRAKELFKEQVADAASKRNALITQAEKTRKNDAEQLRKNKKDLIDDLRIERKERQQAREELESSWQRAADCKTHDPSIDDNQFILLHEQCKKYVRCRQCQRKRENKGRSNILSESRYIGGSRLIV